MPEYPKWKSFIIYVWFFFAIPALCFYAGRCIFPDQTFLSTLIGLVCGWSLWWAGGEALDNAERKYLSKKQEEQDEILRAHMSNQKHMMQQQAEWEAKYGSRGIPQNDWKYAAQADREGISLETVKAYELARKKDMEEQKRLSAQKAQKRKEDIRNFIIGLVAFVFVVAIAAGFLFPSENKVSPLQTTKPANATIPPYKTAAPTSSTKTSSSNSATLITYYKMNFPMTWGYISKYSDNPSEYIVFYHDVWGDLQKYHGDGIPFDTLSWYEQSLVDYPDIGSYIYFAVGGKTYHSTRDCYTLLRSETSLRSSQFASQYSPCSKCVGD